MQCINAAVSTQQGKVKLELEGSNSRINNKEVSSTFFEVDCYDITGLITDKPLLLKMDIEGGELEFFPDVITRLPKKYGVFLETHTAWEDLSLIKKTFLSNGFSFEVMSESGLFIDSFAQRTS